MHFSALHGKFIDGDAPALGGALKHPAPGVVPSCRQPQASLKRLKRPNTDRNAGKKHAGKKARRSKKGK